KPTIIIILGATGDLTWGKLVPAIYNLYLDKWTPDNFAVIGVGHSKIGIKEFQKHLQEGIDKFSRRGKAKKKDWDTFIKCLYYLKGEFEAASTYHEIDAKIKHFEKTWKTTPNLIFYLAVPPNSFETIAQHI